MCSRLRKEMCLISCEEADLGRQIEKPCASWQLSSSIVLGVLLVPPSLLFSTWPLCCLSFQGLCLAPFLSLMPRLVNPSSSSSCFSPLSRSSPSSSFSSSTFLDVLYIAAAEGASEACEACVHACTTACAVSPHCWPSKECPLSLLRAVENSVLFSPDSLTSLLLHTTVIYATLICILACVLKTSPLFTYVCLGRG